jgi:hypothetical protein
MTQGRAPDTLHPSTVTLVPLLVRGRAQGTVFGRARGGNTVGPWDVGFLLWLQGLLWQVFLLSSFSSLHSLSSYPCFKQAMVFRSATKEHKTLRSTDGPRGTNHVGPHRKTRFLLLAPCSYWLVVDESYPWKIDTLSFPHSVPKRSWSRPSSRG